MKRFEPTSQAKYVQFFTLNDRTQMPGVRYPVLEWPYREGLTIAEAMHPLAFVAVGLYGKVLPNQNGAPIRTVLPWKYGFKSCKSIVRIHFTDTPTADELEHGGAATSTASTRTSIRKSITRVGARRRSGVSAAACSRRAFRRRCSTAMATRSPASTRASTSPRTTDRAAGLFG